MSVIFTTEMATAGIPKRKRVKRYISIPNDVKAELVRRGLTVRGLAQRYGVSRFLMGRILAGWEFKKAGKWEEVKEALLKDYPWLKAYIGS